jgi:hypothetical protein
MNREEIQKLLGGYATGTLTPEEQQALFAAALEDQELFDALGREQALRDLLRDPAAKAELLAALDAPAAGRGGFWEWVRRPMVAGLAMAGVATIAVIAVWQATRTSAPAPVMVAELKVEEAKAPPTAPEVKLPEAPRRQVIRAKPNKDLSALIAPATPAPAPPLPPPAAAAPPQTIGSTARAVAEATPAAQGSPERLAKTELMDQTAAVSPGLDARSLFYGNSFVRRENAARVPSFAAGSGGAQPSLPKAMTTMGGAVAGNISTKELAAISSLGVRVSVLRGEEEAAVTTVLNPGESVRLRLTPNVDGFLYVAAREGNGWTMVASGPAQRLKPFETPALPFAGSGQQQLYVMLSRTAQTLNPQSIAGLARANLVGTPAAQDRATYVVANQQNEVPQHVVQPITLTYR